MQHGEDAARRGGRALELVLAFVLLPLAVALGRHGPWPELPVIPTLLVLGAAALALLVREESFDLWAELRRLPRRHELAAVARRFAILGATLSLAWALLRPEQLFDFPRENPRLWALVMVGYPVLSVLPQELVFRTFFFQRYAPLFGGATAWASALVFGWVHVVFWNVPAVALTIVGGWLFATTYRRTSSLWAASFEHALYGGLVFTVGLGRYFYGGTVEFVAGAAGQ